MVYIHDIILPARFVTLIGHLVAVIMVFYTKAGNIRAALKLSEQSTTHASWINADSYLNGALVLSLICFAIEFVGLFGGFSMFRPRLSFLYTGLHFTGGLLVAVFIINASHYQYMWLIFVFFSLLPAGIETAMILGVVVFKKRAW